MSERISETFSVAGAILASLGGAGAILLLLSGWLGKVWASRIMEREKAELVKSIEERKTELTRSIEREKAEMAKFHEEHRSELLELLSQRQDALNRKRNVYTRLATSMRVLLKAEVQREQQEKDKRDFLEAYDRGYIWAGESVIRAIADLIETLEQKAAVDAQLSLTPANAPNVQQIRAAAQTLDATAQTRYRRCMFEMRKDAGFADSTAEYRLVSFR